MHERVREEKRGKEKTIEQKMEPIFYHITNTKFWWWKLLAFIIYVSMVERGKKHVQPKPRSEIRGVNKEELGQSVLKKTSNRHVERCEIETMWTKNMCCKWMGFSHPIQHIGPKQKKNERCGDVVNIEKWWKMGKIIQYRMEKKSALIRLNQNWI